MSDKTRRKFANMERDDAWHFIFTSADMKTIIWKSEEYESREYCCIREHEYLDIHSTIIGAAERKPYRVNYELLVNSDWLIQRFSIQYEVHGITKSVAGKKKNGLWVIDGQDAPGYTNYKFIDISLTPFTNTLPIRHLNLEIGQQQEIEVIYIDVLEDLLRPARQRYTRTGEQVYKFETIPDDFEADITVDASGFVEVYPSLFDKLGEHVTGPS